MIQKSLSPVAKSRISSFCGNTMRVEYRSFARTEITSCCEYFTVRATPVWAKTGNDKATANQSIATERLLLRNITGIVMLVLLLKPCFELSVLMASVPLTFRGPFRIHGSRTLLFVCDCQKGQIGRAS